MNGQRRKREKRRKEREKKYFLKRSGESKE